MHGADYIELLKLPDNVDGWKIQPALDYATGWMHASKNPPTCFTLVRWLCIIFCLLFCQSGNSLSEWCRKNWRKTMSEFCSVPTERSRNAQYSEIPTGSAKVNTNYLFLTVYLPVYLHMYLHVYLSVYLHMYLLRYPWQGVYVRNKF